MATTRTFYDVIRSAPKGRFAGIKRNYTVEEVMKLRGSLHIEHTLATRGANRLWDQLKTEPYINSLGALSGNQAMQMVRAGLRAIYLSGWQVAADANTAGSMYPDQSLYPANSGPDLCRRINKTLQRCDQIEHGNGGVKRDWFVPIVADAEAGFGGPLNCFEIMKSYIEAGAAGVHFEDQLAAEKKCGHLGGKVLIPTQAHERNLNAARLAADICGVPTVLISRTDAESAKLITSDVDERDHEFIDFQRGRTAEGFYRLKSGTGLAHCIRRGLSAAPYADLLWWETSTPDWKLAKEFADAIRKEYPDKMMAYNCSPSFNWEANLSKEEIAQFQKELAAMGYKFQFVTLAGFHALNYSMFQLALDYKDRGMAAYSRMQQAEFALAHYGYTAINHQREVGTGYFDQVAMASGGGQASTTALEESTETAQFNQKIKETLAAAVEATKPAGKEKPVQPMEKPVQPKEKPLESANMPPLSYANRPIGTSYDPFGVRPARQFHTSARAQQAATTSTVDGSMKLTMPLQPGDDKVLSEEALKFLLALHQKFEPKRQQLLNARQERQARIDAGEDMPDFLKETAQVRKGDWKIKGTPKDLQDRRVEITGPVDRKMVINALNSGAKTFMADFEDSNTPTWRNQIDGQRNLMDAVRRKITHVDPQTKKEYKLAEKTAVLLVRPRGWHLPEKHILIKDGTANVPMSGSLFDFGLYFFHNAKELLNNSTGPYYYLPKMQSHKEAALWNDVFNFAQDHLGIPRGTIKATVLIEHILATFEADEILHALKDHIVGLNCGRWDYIFSYIKVFRNHPRYLLPDRSLITMEVPFMRNYSKFIIRACHRRGAHAMGGMSAFIPVKNDPKVNDAALAEVRRDKEREASDGHDGTWVAHPGLVPLATEVFNRLMPQANQVNVAQDTTHALQPTAQSLLEAPKGDRTEAGLRRNITVTLGYLESWLRGQGCVPLFNLMEDAATAEISRTQLWQWVHQKGKLNDGRSIDAALMKKVIDEEKAKWKKSSKEAGGTLDEAADLLRELVHAKQLPDFLTLPAYERVIAKGL